MFEEIQKNFTLIARFDDAGKEKINSLISRIDERVCRVPYCRVPDSERYAVDNLPYHFSPFSLKVGSLGLYSIWPGKLVWEL